jgi:putative glycosyltransferase (TIGR04372 family)
LPIVTTTKAKIRPLRETVEVTGAARSEGRSIGLFQGAVDVSDVEQLRRLEDFAFQVDMVVVAVPVRSGAGAPQPDDIANAEIAAGLESVDLVALYPAGHEETVRGLIAPSALLSGLLPSPANQTAICPAEQLPAAGTPPRPGEMELPDFRMALSLRQKGEPARAVTHLYKARAQQPASIAILHELGLCQRLTGDVQGSIPTFLEALRLASRNETLHHLLGLSWRDCGQLEQAVQSFRAAIAIRDDVAEFHYDLGVALRGTGQLAAAADSFQRAAELKGGDAQSLHQAALAQFEAGLLEPAVETLRGAIHQHPANEAFHHLLGLCLRQLGRLIEAAAAFQCAIDINPNVELFFHDIAIALRDLNDHNGVVAMMENIIRLNPGDPNAYMQLADAWQQKGEHYQALRWLRRFLREQNPDLLAVWLALGHCLREMGRLDEAMRIYRHVSEMAERRPELAANCPGVLAAACEYRGDPVGAAHWAEAERMLWEDDAIDARRNGQPMQRVISFGKLNGSIGDLAMRFDLYVKAAKLGLTDGHDAVVLAPPEHPFVNPAFIDHWRPYLRFEHDPATVARLRHAPWGLQEQLQEFRLRGDRYRFFPSVYARVTQLWDGQNRPPLLSVGEADRTRGWQALTRLGMKEGDWFVCLHVRDGGYYRESETGCNSLSLHRSAPIETYLPAIDHIIDRGGWVIRLGDRSAQKLDYKRQGFIDYAWSDERSDWMDIFLMGSCRFLIGTNSGPMCVAAAFGTPCAISNYIPFSIAAPGPNNLFTPKMLYSRKLGRYLTFNEMLAPPFRDANRHHLYRLFERKLGVRLEANGAEDILNMTRDMFTWLEKGEAARTMAADPRHRRLAELCGQNDGHYVAKLPQSFLDRFTDAGCLDERDLAEEFFDRWQHAFPRVEEPADLHFVHAPPTNYPPIYDRLNGRQLAGMQG